MARRRRRRRGDRGAEQGGLIDRVWTYATDVRTPGIFMVLAGVLLASTPWTRTPDPLVVSWWDSPLYLPDPLGVAAGLASVAAVLLLGTMWNRYRLASDPDLAETATPDASVQLTDGDDVGEARRPWFAWAGALCMLSGIAVVVGYWFFAQQMLGTARVPVAVGETIEHYTLPYGQKGLKVMLPLRVRVDGLERKEGLVANVQLFKAGQEPPSPQGVPAGSGVEMGDFRLTFVGMQPDATKLRAVLQSSAPNTIPAVASEGDSFRLSLDGPEYKVLEVSQNYLGVMGPAVKVSAPKVGEFWVFQSASQAKVPPDLEHSIVLDRLQTQPAAVFAVAKAQPFWPLSLGGTLFVLGFALLIVFPERISRRKDGRVRIWSFNEAGRITEQLTTAPSPAKRGED
ncbi:hypothetical protein FIV42_26770 [Persicimonas caeni]|uniref:Cytochrome c biogenesis protein ResB n=1 Tax=Persicimonas caeni TaxID=2292766 RepID=A0A4Y6Q2I9_PERCE|nr:hypothetical protein [Persicimonas caeni]QDG54215.1 hypothetical protein FIV42_26770 [Persicimonas caeni]QED35436.1 hypothetical protein FRD00_26765 [Persicimonas caeni]